MSTHPRGKQLKRSLTFMKKDERGLEKPIFKGYMYKEAAGAFHTAFNRRYFVLYNRYLVYYEKEQDYTKDVADGNLDHRHGAIRLDRLYLTKPDIKPKGGKYCFVLHAPDKANKRHEYLLVTKTREERRQWMTKLQEMNPKLLPHDVHIAPDTPLPARKIRSDSFNPESAAALALKIDDSDVQENELNLQDGDSDQEYHEPDEENERSNGHNGHSVVNDDSDCATISLQVIPLNSKT